MKTNFVRLSRQEVKDAFYKAATEVSKLSSHASSLSWDAYCQTVEPERGKNVEDSLESAMVALFVARTHLENLASMLREQSP